MIIFATCCPRILYTHSGTWAERAHNLDEPKANISVAAERKERKILFKYPTGHLRGRYGTTAPPTCASAVHQPSSPPPPTEFSMMVFGRFNLGQKQQKYKHCRQKKKKHQCVTVRCWVLFVYYTKTFEGYGEKPAVTFFSIPEKHVFNFKT